MFLFSKLLLGICFWKPQEEFLSNVIKSDLKYSFFLW